MEDDNVVRVDFRPKPKPVIAIIDPAFDRRVLELLKDWAALRLATQTKTPDPN
jgi:hypothetical protein